MCFAMFREIMKNQRVASMGSMGSLDVTLGQCVDATYVDAQHAHAADVQGDPFPRANEAFDFFLLTEVDVVVLVATTNVFEVRYHR